MGKQFLTLYDRLVNNTYIPEGQSEANGCWVWVGTVSNTDEDGSRSRRKQYPRFSLRIGGKHRTLKAHRAMLVASECAEEPELFADLYMGYSILGFESDHHGCNNGLCINPDHTQWLHRDEHLQVTREREQGIWS